MKPRGLSSPSVGCLNAAAIVALLALAVTGAVALITALSASLRS